MVFRRVWYFFMAAIGLAPPALAVTITDHTLVRPEGLRHYIAAEADGKLKAKRPVLILLHGHGTSAALMVGLASLGGYKTDAWTTLVSHENILLLAPDGVMASDGKKAWNDCRGDAPTNTTVDDVGFIAALIDTAISQFDADPERIYVFGVSHGGAMAYRAFATRYIWGSDPAGIQVEFLRVDGGGHVEAAKHGALPWFLRKLVGEMNHDLDTSEEVWSFFKTKKKH